MEGISEPGISEGRSGYFSHPRPLLRSPDRPVCALVVDAEEDFDWTSPAQGTVFTTHCMRRVRELQDLVSAFGVRPSYLLTYPVLDDPDVVRIVRRQFDRGDCDLGAQLHPWVNPPFCSELGLDSSFVGSLSPEAEETKLLALKAKFRDCFGHDPVSFRAGRYGLGERTTRLLEKHGFLVDTSLAPRTNLTAEKGPNFSGFDCDPFWFGEHRDILEVPLCRTLTGWGGAAAAQIYEKLSKPAFARIRGHSILSRLRYAERITLSPEGNDRASMVRLLRDRLAKGQRLFSLSCHSSSLTIGRNPYVRSKADLHTFYDRLSGVLDIMQSRLGFRFAVLSELPDLLADAAR